jgi:chorismate-pyruvate lyase
MMSHNATTAAVPDVDAGPDPLCWFTESSRAFLSAATLLPPEQVPEPYHALLVHDGSMTERLERHFGEPMTLEILSLCASVDRYARWILLQDARGRCVEIGGVCLDLRRFQRHLRADILEGEEPLGRLLSRHGLMYRSVPHAFVGFTVTPRLQDLLQMAEPRRVFGRRTGLRANGQMLGMVVEVLPCYDVQTSRRPLMHAVSQQCFTRNDP